MLFILSAYFGYLEYVADDEQIKIASFRMNNEIN